MVDLRIGLIVGVSAAATTPVGRLVATWVSPSVGAILFNIFLLSIIASTILKDAPESARPGLNDSVRNSGFACEFPV